MRSKLIAACMAVAAFAAFAMAGSASAAQLTHPTGTPIPTGTKILGTNTNGNTKFTAGLITVECSSAVLTGTLTKNSSTENTEGTIESAHFTGTGPVTAGMTGGDCTSPEPLGATKVTTNVGNGTPWCVKSIAGTDEAQIRGNSCANAARSITFVLDTVIGECKYERTTATGPIKGEITTDTPGTQDAVVHLTGGANTEFKAEAGNPFGCPGSGTLDMSITLETHKPTAEPLYFS